MSSNYEYKGVITEKELKQVFFGAISMEHTWNYERMMNDGYLYAMLPALKKIYPDPEDFKEACKRHLEFFNTTPHVITLPLGISVAMEEKRAQDMENFDTASISNVKTAIMGPLAGIGDSFFWGTLRILATGVGTSLALQGNILGPILFFVLWNVIRLAFMWYTQEFGYNVGTKIAEDMSGGLLGKITQGASILGMFIIGALVQRWVSISFTPVVSSVTQSEGAYIDWSQIQGNADGIKSALEQYSSLGATGLNQIKVTTLQQNLDSLIPGLAALLLTLLCCKLLKKKVSPITIIIALFVVGIVGRVIGIM